jgi:ribosomal-protein-serine acetyltransferase
MRAVTLEHGVVMRPYRMEDTTRVFATIEAERTRLSRFMPWAPHSTAADSTEDFIRSARRQEADGTGFHLGLFHGQEALGAIGATVDLLNREAEVGYWIAAEWEGRGLITSGVIHLLGFLFDDYEIHRVVIRAAVENTRSRAIPERLGFTQEGVLREALVLEGVSTDAAIYSLLAPEWKRGGGVVKS